MRAILIGLALRAIFLRALTQCLLEAGFAYPTRAMDALRIWGIFRRATRASRLTLEPIFETHGVPQPVRLRLRRYARNCIGLIAVQPQLASRSWSQEDVAIQTAAVFGACIPLYDDCFDTRSALDAQNFAHAFACTLQQETWVVSDLPAYADEQTTALARDFAARLWTGVPAPSRRRFVRWLGELNEAQLRSIEERSESLSLETRRDITHCKGSSSFLLLLSATTGWCAPDTSLLIRAGAWAQFVDDFDDYEEDRALGLLTYVRASGTQRQAVAWLWNELQSIAADLGKTQPQDYRQFGNLLRLNLAVKVAHAATRETALRWQSLHLAPSFYAKPPAPL